MFVLKTKRLSQISLTLSKIVMVTNETAVDDNDSVSNFCLKEMV